MSEDRSQVFKQKLQKDFPEFTISSIKVIGTGWHHDAIEVNDSVIFRIPHNTYGEDITPETVLYETKLLKTLKDKLHVAIPDPQYIAPDKSYFGYPKLGGVLLRDLIKTFNKEDWSQLRDDWVAIACDIHKNVSVEAARSLIIPDFEEPGLASIERIFDIQVDEDVKDFARKILKQREDYDQSPGPYVFMHNDLQFHNILADPETKRITGLIDWTDACVGPLPREFSIDEWVHGNLLEEVTKLYEDKTGVYIDVQQARMWRGLEELGDYIEEVEAGELEEAAKTLVRIKNLAAIEN